MFLFFPTSYAVSLKRSALFGNWLYCAYYCCCWLLLLFRFSFQWHVVDIDAFLICYFYLLNSIIIWCIHCNLSPQPKSKYLSYVLGGLRSRLCMNGIYACLSNIQTYSPSNGKVGFWVEWNHMCKIVLNNHCTTKRIKTNATTENRRKTYLVRWILSYSSSVIGRWIRKIYNPISIT